MRKGMKNCWDAFHMAHPVWTQTVSRLLLNQMVLAAIQQDGKQKDRPQEPSPSCHQQLGADEENIIRYMAGYIPFKLLKVYKRKNTEAAAEVGDCLRAMAQSDLEDDFYVYTQEWTKAISRGCVFTVMLPFYFSETWHTDEGVVVSAFGEPYHQQRWCYKSCGQWQRAPV